MLYLLLVLLQVSNEWTGLLFGIIRKDEKLKNKVCRSLAKEVAEVLLPEVLPELIGKRG